MVGVNEVVDKRTSARWVIPLILLSALLLRAVVLFTEYSGSHPNFVLMLNLLIFFSVVASMVLLLGPKSVGFAGEEIYIVPVQLLLTGIFILFALVAAEAILGGKYSRGIYKTMQAFAFVSLTITFVVVILL